MANIISQTHDKYKEKINFDYYLFSYHGLPEKQLDRVEDKSSISFIIEELTTMIKDRKKQLEVLSGNFHSVKKEAQERSLNTEIEGFQNLKVYITREVQVASNQEHSISKSFKKIKALLEEVRHNLDVSNINETQRRVI